MPLNVTMCFICHLCVFLGEVSQRHLFSFWNINDMDVKSSVIVPQVPETLFIFIFSLFYLCLSDWVISMFLSSSSLILSSATSILLLSQSIELLNLRYWFLNSKIFAWLFVISSISLLRLSVFFQFSQASL